MKWRPPKYVRPGDPLPRLVARCGRVKLGSLSGLKSLPPAWDPHPWDPTPMLAVVRLMGLPDSLHLAHGRLQTQTQQELASRGAAVAAAEPGQPAGGPAALAPVERRQTRQMARLQRQRQQQQRVQSQQLQLDTATPEQVLLMAVDELAAAAAQAAGGNRGGGVGGGGGGAGGHLVMLRGALLPRYDRAWNWKMWMEAAVEHFVRLAMQEHPSQMRRGAGGAPPTAGTLCSAKERCWRLINTRRDHVAALAAGVLLLRCHGTRSAAELAALLSGAAGAGPVQRRGDTASARAITAAVMQKQADGNFTADSVLRSRIFTGPHQGDGSGGGGSSSSNSKATNEEALRQLLVLDHGVRRLWRSVRVPYRAAAD
ncbi:hypothetical protein HXX76_008539 [Chlamydomonas incerta]|uniref:Uncharacterized protein n=1 Tax=Chlamydomonas incerta TaxID=51695 RepID=A0A835VYP2_CHLIN|nr:hypothetical protein HXX76_008539 [Chlamydomonas incerta]|eukprot:KAG2432805.1 hypothetical protein HXX76_008539 [Chlamydomonas incerta]